MQKKVDPQNIFYINKEFTAFDEIRTSSDLEALFMYYKTAMQVKGKIFLFLDEVQNIEDWEVLSIPIRRILHTIMSFLCQAPIQNYYPVN